MEDVFLTGGPNEQQRITFKLDSGRLVWVVTFRYAGTYDSLLEGRPDAKFNAEIMESELKTARRLSGDAVLMLPPPTRTDQYGGVHLPPCCCRAELMSSAMKPDMHASSLTVVWFREPFFSLPLGQFVADSLRSVQWERNAQDFEF